MEVERAEFSTRTRRLLADRAGHQCAAPSCGQKTIGPGASPHEVSNIGTASHIFAAAPGGPRGTGGLSPAQRSDVANGIWLCGSHGRLIDNNEGGAYPSALLQGWRGLHEARTRLALGGKYENFGWVEKLHVAGAPAVGSHKLVLSSHNLIVGQNGTGKTTLLRLLASVANPDELVRLTSFGKSIDAEVVWHDPQLRVLRIHAREGAARFELDGRDAPFVPRPYRALTVHTWRTYGADDLASSYGIGRLALLNTLKKSQELAGGCIKDATINEEGHLEVAIASGEMKTRWVKPNSGQLSGHEFLNVSLDICLSIASIQAREGAAVLLLDAVTAVLDVAAQKLVYDRLTSKRWPFQIVATTSSDDLSQVGADWLITRLQPSRGVGVYSVVQER